MIILIICILLMTFLAIANFGMWSDLYWKNWIKILLSLGSLVVFIAAGYICLITMMLWIMFS